MRPRTCLRSIERVTYMLDVRRRFRECREGLGLVGEGLGYAGQVGEVRGRVKNVDM